MKHQHHNHHNTTRNILIICAAIAVIIIGGLYFWHKNQPLKCNTICTTVDEEKDCTDICVKQ